MSPNFKVPFIFLIVIIMMGSVGLLATDIYLPALPEMATYFNCSQSEIQSSLTVFLLGLALCQLTFGVLCDRFGRKKVTLYGLSLFIVGSLLCALSTSLFQFIGARILQAIGGGVGSVVVRAIIGSRYNKTQAVKIFSTTFPIIGLSAAIGPFIGGYLTYFFSWKSAFYFMIFYGLITFLLVLFYLKEDPSDKSILMEKAMIKKTFQGYWKLFKNVNFLGYSLVICAGFSAFRSYTVESPFVFDTQGFLIEEMSWFYIALSLAYIIGNLFAKRLVNTVSMEKVLGIGFWFFILGGLTLILGAFFIEKSPYTIILPMAVVVLGNGFLFPTGSAGAMSSVPGNSAGMASGLMGALQFISAAFCIHWVGGICKGQALFMSMFIGAIILAGFFSFLILIHRRKIFKSELEIPHAKLDT